MSKTKRILLIMGGACLIVGSMATVAFQKSIGWLMPLLIFYITMSIGILMICVGGVGKWK